jgi:hypothetical protein
MPTTVALCSFLFQFSVVFNRKNLYVEVLVIIELEEDIEKLYTLFSTTVWQKERDILQVLRKILVL